MNLDDIVLQSESLVKHLDEDAIPHVHKSIEQLRQQGEKLSFSRAAQSDIKAAKLLGSKVGYELSAGLTKTLESLSVLSSYDPVSDVNIEDIPKFLKNEGESAILAAINLTRQTTMSEGYKRAEAAKRDWWTNEKNRLLGVIGNADKLPQMLQNMSHRTLENSIDFGNIRRGNMNREEAQYAREIGKVISERLQLQESRSGSIVTDAILYNENSPLNSSKSSELSEICRLLQRYCSVKLDSINISDARLPDSNFSRLLLLAAVEHLEVEFSEYIKQCAATLSYGTQYNDKRALIVFTQMNLLPADWGCFDDGNIFGVPVWPLIYCCLRSGRISDAVDVAKDAVSNLSDFHLVLSHFIATGCLSAEQMRKMTADYKRHIRMGSDPYKKLIYSLLTGCDTDDGHGQVLTSVDDFLWFRLCHLRRAHIASDDSMSLVQLQKMIADEYGESHFQAQSQPLTFCKILLLCQLFENAFAFLLRFDVLRCHAVHAAIALFHQGLLLLSDDLQAPLLSRSGDHDSSSVHLNLSRMVTLYTRKFESSNQREALDLFYLLQALPCGSDEDVDAFVVLSSSLIVQNDQIDIFFCRSFVSDDEYYRPGGASNMLTRYGDVAGLILSRVTSRLRSMGRTEDACRLLLLADRHEEAAVDMAELLASTISLSSAKHSDGQRLRDRAQMIIAHCPSPSAGSDLLSRVLDISTFCAMSSADGYVNVDAAMAALDGTRLFPVSSDTGCMRVATDEFHELPELIRSMMPVLLVTAMRTLRTAAASCRNSREALVDIKQRAKALVTFTGQLPYRMPADVYASLSQLEMVI